jgi:hypothetical protein
MCSLQRFIRLRSMLRTSASGAAILASLVALPASGQRSESVDFRGQVVDRSTGAPVAGAYVKIADRSATTDGEGRFRIRGLPAGEHALFVSHLGYSNYVARARLEPGAALHRIELEPNPVLMAAIQVVADRLKARRNALPFSVRAFGEREMASASTAYDFLRSRLFIGRCPSNMYFATDCVWRRGAWISPEIYIDEVSYRFAGLDILDTYPASELHTIEVLNSGTQIRVYTKWFADRLARGQARLSPIITF